MRMLRWLIPFLLLGSPALAQWQVPDHAVPIGRGAGIVGFKSAAPVTNGVFSSTNSSTDPSFSSTLPTGLTIPSPTITGGLTGALTITSNSANALAVGPNGATNPTFQVESSAASSVTGWKVTSQAAAGGAAFGVVSSGTNEPGALNAKGSGTLTLNNVATGQVILGAGGGGVAINSALTYGGVALANSVTGTGSMALSAGPTFTGTVAIATLSATTINGFTLGGTIAGGGNQLNNIIIGTSTPLAGTFTTATANAFVPNSSSVPTNGFYLPAANTVGWAVNSAAEMQLTSTALSPAVDGGNSLGTTALGWQNLFGNTGFVWNIENGDWVATHTSGILTVGTGDLRVTTAGTNAASVVTVGGTQTLTSKTLTSPVMTTPTLGAATATSVAFSPTTGGLVGTTAGDNAGSGTVGQYTESVITSGSSVSLVTSTGKDVTSIVLGAGDWDITAAVMFSCGATTSVTGYAGYLSTTADTPDLTPGRAAQQIGAAFVPNASVITQTLPVYRSSSSGSTTWHLVALGVFTTSTMNAFGIIRARRVR